MAGSAFPQTPYQGACSLLPFAGFSHSKAPIPLSGFWLSECEVRRYQMIVHSSTPTVYNGAGDKS